MSSDKMFEKENYITDFPGHFYGIQMIDKTDQRYLSEIQSYPVSLKSCHKTIWTQMLIQIYIADDYVVQFFVEKNDVIGFDQQYLQYLYGLIFSSKKWAER